MLRERALKAFAQVFYCTLGTVAITKRLRSLTAGAFGQAFLSQTGVHAKRFGGLAESLISCPQKRRRIDKDRSYQVSIGQTDAQAVQTSSLDG